MAAARRLIAVALMTASAFFPILPVQLAADDTPPPPPHTQQVLAVYGDSYAGADYGGNLYTGWAATVARQLDLELVNMAVSGSGYRLSANWSCFPYAATVHPVPQADVVVVFGSLNDNAQDPEAVRQAAVVTFAAIRAANPDVPIIAVGPTWPNGNPPANLWYVKDGIHNAAAALDGVLHVDAMRWFFGRPELIGPDGWHPNVAGHAYLADRIRPYVAQVLGR